jgi:hypothetical protein
MGRLALTAICGVLAAAFFMFLICNVISSVITSRSDDDFFGGPLRLKDAEEVDRWWNELWELMTPGVIATLISVLPMSLMYWGFHALFDNLGVEFLIEVIAGAGLFATITLYHNRGLVALPPPPGYNEATHRADWSHRHPWWNRVLTFFFGLLGVGILLGFLAGVLWMWYDHIPWSQDSLKSELMGRTEAEVESKLGRTPTFDPLLLSEYFHEHIRRYDISTKDPKTGAESSHIYVHFELDQDKYTVAAIYFTKQELKDQVPPFWVLQEWLRLMHEDRDLLH